MQDHLLLFGEKLIVTPALRYSDTRDDYDGHPNELGETSEIRKWHESFWTPQIGLKFKPWTWLALKTNWAQYVREPTFYELYGDRGFLRGNGSLDAEQGVNYDVGFEIQRLRQDGILNRFALHGTYFRSEVRDGITWVYNAQGTGRSVNISKARIEGYEFGATLDINHMFRITGNVTWQDAEDRSDIQVARGKRLPGRYEWAWVGRFEVRHQGFKIYWEVNREEGMYYDRANLLKARTKDEVNLGLSWLYRATLLNFTIRNLGDARYEDFNGYPLPGRSYYLTISQGF